jgi:hypothetical protein
MSNILNFVYENLQENYLKDVVKVFNKSTKEELQESVNDLIEVYARFYHNTELIL